MHRKFTLFSDAMQEFAQKKCKVAEKTAGAARKRTRITRIHTNLFYSLDSLDSCSLFSTTLPASEGSEHESHESFLFVRFVGFVFAFF
ncbi:MAG: hypothetical protein ACI4AM_05330, partial [Muribaculaceae bacterium]